MPTRERVPSGPLTCHLRCISISRGTARSDVKALWDTTWTTNTALIYPRMGLPLTLPLTLPLPDHGQPTNIDRRTGAGVPWQLNVVIPLRRGSEEPVFDLPVRC